MAKYIAGSVTQVWPGIFSGSAMIANPPAWKRGANIDIAFVMSRSTYMDYGWHTVQGVVPLYFDDTPEGLTVGQVARLIRTLHVYSNARVACLCQAGLNRSSFVACLYRWLHTNHSMANIVRELTDARVKDGVYDVLCNRAFVADLLSCDYKS